MDFEHLKIPLPSGYEKFIETVWGTIEFPDCGERIPHHGGIIDVDTPYTDKRYRRHMDTFKGLTNEKILLFGAGRNAKRYLRRHGKRFPPIYIFDNDPNKWGGEIKNIPIINPNKLPDMAKGDTRIIIASIYRKAIGEQLEDMGIFDYYIYEEGKKYGKM
jgi:hypothetical protein